MQTGPSVADNLTRRGVDALQRGEAPEAISCFKELADRSPGNCATILLLARAYRLGGEDNEELAAIDRALELEPRNLSALLMRGDWSERRGDIRGAAAFYQAALKGSRSAQAIPSEIVAELRKAQQFIERSGREFQAAIDRAVDEHAPEGAAGLRLRHTLDLLKGTREIAHQRPSALYVPYLSQRQFFEREEFDWIPALEAQSASIRNELLTLLEEGASFRPYVERQQNRPSRDVLGMLEDPSWSALYLWKNGSIIEENAARAPLTMAALEQVPLSRVGSRTPSVLFSMLRPGAHIPPHHGMLNCRLICHLPLIVPPGCWLRVGNETREWEEGKVMVFDDSMIHEARNPTNETRVILLFEIWRPELTDSERACVSAIFDTIDRFTTLPEG